MRRIDPRLSTPPSLGGLYPSQRSLNRNYLPRTRRPATVPVKHIDELSGQRFICCEVGVDLSVPQQKLTFVQLLATHPARHLGVALAGVAGAAAGHDVGHLIAPSARDRQHAVFLQRLLGRAAVGASAPGGLQCGPLHTGELVHLGGDAASATAGVPLRARRTSGRHGPNYRGSGRRRLVGGRRVAAPGTQLESRSRRLSSRSWVSINRLCSGSWLAGSYKLRGIGLKLLGQLGSTTASARPCRTRRKKNTHAVGPLNVSTSPLVQIDGMSQAR